MSEEIEVPEIELPKTNSFDRWITRTVAGLLVVIVGFWLASANALTAKVEELKTAVAVHEKQLQENDEWRKDVKRDLRDINAKLDLLLQGKR